MGKARRTFWTPLFINTAGQQLLTKVKDFIFAEDRSFQRTFRKSSSKKLEPFYIFCCMQSTWSFWICYSELRISWIVLEKKKKKLPRDVTTTTEKLSKSGMCKTRTVHKLAYKEGIAHGFVWKSICILFVCHVGCLTASLSPTLSYGALLALEHRSWLGLTYGVKAGSA